VLRLSPRSGIYPEPVEILEKLAALNI